MEKSYNKFQLSKMFGNNREYQVVIRTDDAQELIDALKQIKPFIQVIEGEIDGTRPVTVSNDVVERHVQSVSGQVCQKCGAEMVRNPKTGKMFCKEKCWLKTTI